MKLSALFVPVLLAGSLVGPLAGSVHGEELSALARVLPPETPVYLEVNAPTAEEAKQLVLFKMLEDPRLKALLSGIVGHDSSLTTMSMPLGHGVMRIHTDMSAPNFDVKIAWHAGKRTSSFKMKNRFAFAWCGMAKQDIPVDLVAAVEVEGEPEQAISVIQRIVVGAVLGLGQQRRAKHVRAEFVQRKLNGVPVTHCSIAGTDIYLVPMGKLVVLATSSKRVKDLVARYRGRGDESLATSADYRKIMATAPGSGTATTVMMIRVRESLAAIQKGGPEYAGIAALADGGLKAIGLWDLRSFSTVTRVDGRGFSSTTAVRLNEAKRLGVARLFDGGPPAKLGALAFAPRDSIYASCGRFDLGGLFKIYSELESLATQGRTNPARDMFKAAFDLDLEKDLTNLVGPEAALIVAPTRGLVPDIGLVFESSDAAHLERTVLKLLSRYDWPAGTGIRSVKANGAHVHTVPLGDRRLADVPVSPTFGVVDGRFVITLYPGTFHRLAGVARGERPSLLQNREFVRLRERVPAGSLGVSYLDVGRVIEFLYDTGLPLLQSIPQFSAVTPLHYEFPDATVMSRSLYGRIAWREADEHGAYWRSHSSIDTSGTVLGAIGVGAALVGYLEESEAKTPRSRVQVDSPVKRSRDREVRQCESHVRFWGRRLGNYRRRRGMLPATLEAVRPMHDAPLTVPGTNTQYTYLGNKGLLTSGILLYGAPNGPDQKITVLTAKLRVARKTKAELESALNPQSVRRSGK